MQINLYSRKPFEVEGVQVTRENLDELGAWVGGKVVRIGDQQPYIMLPEVRKSVLAPKANVNDWILRTGRSFKVYTNGAFQRSFELKDLTPVPNLKEMSEAMSAAAPPIPDGIFAMLKQISDWAVGLDEMGYGVEIYSEQGGFLEQSIYQLRGVPKANVRAVPAGDGLYVPVGNGVPEGIAYDRLTDTSPESEVL